MLRCVSWAGRSHFHGLPWRSSEITHCSISTAGGSLLKLTNANPQYCVRSGLRVLSALGAGGKANAAELHVARLAEVYNDPIGTALLKRFKADKSGKLGIRRSKGQTCAVAEQRQISMSSEPLEPHEDSLRNPTNRAGARDESWWLEVANQVWVVYSSELQQVSLLPLPQGVDARELGSQPSFRVRVMPVMPPLPAAFGAALAGAGISMLLESPPSPPPRPVPTLTISFARKLYQRFLKHELSDRKSAPGSIQLSIDDVVTVVCDIFRCRCALTGARLHDPGRRNFMLCRWDLARDASVENVLFATVDAAEQHEIRGPSALSSAQSLQISEAIRTALEGRAPSLFEYAQQELRNS